MTEQIISKTCRVCKKTKPISEFYKRSDSRDGHRNACKICYLKDNKAARKRYHQSKKGKAARKRYEQSEKGKAAHKHFRKTGKGKIYRNRSAKRYAIRHPKQVNAKHVVMQAIRIGQLPRPDSLQCHYCPARAKQYHHWHGYEPEHRLDVVPVCIKCHAAKRGIEANP